MKNIIDKYGKDKLLSIISGGTLDNIEIKPNNNIEKKEVIISNKNISSNVELKDSTSELKKIINTTKDILISQNEPLVKYTDEELLKEYKENLSKLEKGEKYLENERIPFSDRSKWSDEKYIPLLNEVTKLDNICKKRNLI